MKDEVKKTGDRSLDEVTSVLARASVYKLLSQAMLYPDAAFYELISSGRLVAELETCRRYIQGRGLSEVEGPASLETLQEEYVGIFSHTVMRSNSPYEAEYGQAHVFQQTQCLADIAAFYRAFGLEISDDERERPDHIGIELEFMHFLACQEAHAMQSDGPEEVSLVRQTQRDFLTDHLGCWAPHFLKRIEEGSIGFYRGMIQLAHGFLEDECSNLGLDPAEMDFAASPVAMPGDDAAPLCMTGPGSPNNPEEDFS